MSKDFDPRRFLQRAPNAMLRRYFAVRDLLPDLDWEQLTETRVEPLYQAWLAMPPESRDESLVDFREIDLLGDEGGKIAILDEALFHPDRQTVLTAFGELEDFHACAFWTFLERPELWRGAVRFADADNKPKRYWRQRNNMPSLVGAITKATAQRLEAALSELLFRKQARGHRCYVEPYRRDEHEYFFAYPLDHRQSDLELLDGEFRKRARSPTFEIIFMFDPKGRSLRTWWRGNAKLIPDLEVAFSQAVLGKEIDRVKQKDTRIYDLTPLLNRNFQFQRETQWAISDVVVCGLKVRILGEHEATIDLAVPSSSGRYAVYDHFDRLFASIPRTKLRLMRASIKVSFSAVPGLGPKHRKFDVSWPNSCSLQNEGRDLIIQQMLSASGIEPQEPADDDVDEQP